MSKAVLAASCFLIFFSTPRLAAQGEVGYPPSQSPYRDLGPRAGILVTGGYLTGSSGNLGIGPSDGPIAGLRYELGLGGPTDGFIGVSYASLSRLVINPDAPVATRTSGPIRQTVLFVDAGINVLLTGEKTWHHLLPYLGASLGLGFGEAVPGDSSSYRYRAKFVTGPQLGIRWYLAPSVSLRVESRLLFWQLKYPSSFLLAPVSGGSAVLSSTDPTSEWTLHPTFTFGLAYALHL